NLPMPTDRQVAVWTNKGDDFARLRNTLTASRPVAESFFARRETLSVFADGRGDGPYLTLNLAGRRYWENGFDRKLLLSSKSGAIRRRIDGKPVIPTPTLADEPRPLALLTKVMEHEWEQTTASHEASRQLLYASGLLPRNVNVPEWINFG